MKILRSVILFITITTSFCSMVTKSLGQCEIKYNHTIKNASQSKDNGQIDISFDKSDYLPECQIFSYTGNTPYLLIEATRKVDKTKGKVSFYGLAPGTYTIRAGRKGCKPLFIGEHTKIIVGTNQAR